MLFFFFSSRRRHTRCALVTGVQTCALPISGSPTLNTLRHALFVRARRYRRLSALVRPAPRAKRAEHREMMEVMLSGDIAAAPDLFERHKNGRAPWSERVCKYV